MMSTDDLASSQAKLARCCSDNSVGLFSCSFTERVTADNNEALENCKAPDSWKTEMDLKMEEYGEMVNFSRISITMNTSCLPQRYA